MKSSKNGHTEVVKLLHDYGAQVDLQDNDGWSALMFASDNGHTEVIKLLHEHGAQVDLQNNGGWSALMTASLNGHTEVVKLLNDYGAQLDLLNNDGWSALMVASLNGHIEVVQLLQDLQSDDEFIEISRMEDDHHLNLNESQHDSGDEKDLEVHLIAVENAIRDRGKLDHSLVHGVFVGPPRSGKDSLMKRLLGEMPTDTSPSTGVAENVVHVKVEESSTFAATVEQSNWTRLAYDEEALHLMKLASNKSSDTDQGEHSIDKETAPDLSLAMEDTPITTVHQRHEDTLQINVTPDGQSVIPQSMSTFEEQIVQTQQQLPISKHKTPIEIFKEAIKKKGLEGLKKQLAKSWSLYLTNTGGQMEFQELLPLLVSGPSMFFITFQLHKDLHQCFPVEYELSNGKSSKSYQSSLSILDAILQTLSSIAAMGTFVYKGLQKKTVPLRPKVFIIGTHKDLLDKESATTKINGIDRCLQEIIKPTSHYREGIIQYATESQMIFTVNNFGPDDSDFQRIRSAVEQVVETGVYRMSSPAHWMIYSLIVRQLQNRVETYDECFAIALSLIHI